MFFIDKLESVVVESKVFAAMGVSVTNDRSKLERQERRALMETTKHLQDLYYEFRLRGADLR